MVAVEVIAAGVSITSKAAMSEGLNSYVFVVYYYVLAVIMVLPCFLFYRKPPLTFSLLCKLFLLGLLGSYGMIFAYTGIDYSSPALHSAVINLAPAFVFILATLFRQEKFDIRNRSSQAKALGTIVSVAGAIMVTLYKGQPLTQRHSSLHQLELLSPKSTWITGSLFLIASALFISLWHILQTIIIKEYPSVPIITFWYCFFALLHSAIFTLISQGVGVWRLRHGIEYIAITSAAVGCAIFAVAVHTWYLRVKGPIYVCIFKPLGIVLTFTMNVFVLGDRLYIGSVIGSIVISVGFYGVLWGKYKEEKLNEDIDTSSIDYNHHVPLLGSCR